MFFSKIKQKIAMKSKSIPKIEDNQLNNYLSNFNCTRCHNRCKLSDIRCGGGLNDREEKIAEYNKYPKRYLH